MSTQPTLDVTPTAPLPQTNEGYLHQTGGFMSTFAVLPGGPLDYKLQFTRDCLAAYFDFDSTANPGTSLYSTEVTANQLMPPRSATYRGQLVRTQTAYPWQFGLSTNRYINAGVKLTFWAVKPYGAMSGRIIILYTPPSGTIDNTQRAPAKEWDLSLTNTCSMTIDGFTTGLFRRTGHANLNSGNNGLSKVIATDYDSSWGRVDIKVASVLQPGSIFPSKIQIFMFMSFVDPELRTIIGLPTPVSRLITQTIIV